MRKALLDARETAGHAVWQSGTIDIDLKTGFAMKIHDKLPQAPLSPIYLSLRPDGVKGGKLQPEHLDKIGSAMSLMTIQQGGLFKKDTYTWVAGIPAAGEPILDAMIRTIGSRRSKRIRSFKLRKEESVNGHRIAGIHPDDDGLVPAGENDSHILVDDLMSNMETKLEAVQAVKDYGAGINCILLFLDRSVQGIPKLSSSYSIRTLAVWEFNQLLEFGLAHGYIKRTVYEQIIEYPKQLEKYKAQHAA